ncbi:hypothetical protein HFO91_30575 [Rhizobium leguminosarum]|uniref:hypothetical protein n=1 Tax=Rhizobium leguminosarum TaxID=384 RepID=UPI001C93F996|nr:hypothetical protein [Rhizobium leguminosarum]MBY5453926.1 hypothetical protein [Rhizobium leguminosarum]
MGFFSNRRNKIIDGYLQDMIRAGVSEKSLENLYFEAASRYAQDNGGKLYPDTPGSIIFDKTLNGSNYSIFFMIGRGGKGVHITLTKQRSSYELASEDADRFVATALASTARKPSAEIQAFRDRSLESFTSRDVKRLQPIEERDIHKFFEFYSTPIPVKTENLEGGIIWVGLANLPDYGVLVFQVALSSDEAIINVSGALPTAPGMSQMETISTKAEGLIEILDEMIDEYRPIVASALLEARRAQ